MSIGISGMRRRIADYDPALGIEGRQILITLAALVIGWSVLIMIYNLISSMRRQPVASQRIRGVLVPPNGKLLRRCRNLIMMHQLRLWAILMIMVLKDLLMCKWHLRFRVIN